MNAYISPAAETTTQTMSVPEVTTKTSTGDVVPSASVPYESEAT
jgi:hypothetical protein